jgi:hypothetical protein
MLMLAMDPESWGGYVGVNLVAITADVGTSGLLNTDARGI